MRVLLALFVSLVALPALAETPPERAPVQCEGDVSAVAQLELTAASDKELGFCVGIATRCGLLPKGICYTQQGCMNPFGPYGGDRCNGSARQCTGFARKTSCMMQRGCTWAAQKKKPAPEKTET